MKYLNFVMALLVSLAIALPVTANDLPQDDKMKLRVEAVTENALKIKLVNLQQQTTRIELKELNGFGTYFRDVIVKHNGYLKQLDLSELGIGKYELTVKQGDRVMRQVILIDDELGIVLSNIVG